MSEQPIRVMVVDDHPMWRDAVERDLQAAGFDVVGVAANGTEALARFPACRPQVVVLDLQIPGAQRRRGHRRGAAPGPVGAGADPVRLRRAGRRARGGQGRRDRLPGEVGVPRGAARRRAPGGARATPCSRPGWPGWCWASSAGSPTPATAGPDQPTLTERETEVLQMVAKGHVVQADRRAAGALPPDGAEPRPEHPAQAADAQPGRADPLRHRAGPRRRTTTLPRSEATARVPAPARGRAGAACRRRSTPWSRCTARTSTRCPTRTSTSCSAGRRRSTRGRCLARVGEAGSGRLLLPPERRARDRAARARLRRQPPARARVHRRGATATAPTLNHLVLVVDGLPTDGQPRRPVVARRRARRRLPRPAARCAVDHYDQAGFDYEITEVRDDGWSFRHDRARHVHRRRGHVAADRPAGRRGGAPRAVDAARRARSPSCSSSSAATPTGVDTLRGCLWHRIDGRRPHRDRAGVVRRLAGRAGRRDPAAARRRRRDELRGAVRRRSGPSTRRGRRPAGRDCSSGSPGQDGADVAVTPPSRSSAFGTVQLASTRRFTWSCGPSRRLTAMVRAGLVRQVEARG